MARFSIPFVRNKGVLERILDSNDKIYEMYGGARDLNALGLETFVHIIKTANNRGINFALSVTGRDSYKEAEKLPLEKIPKQKLIIDDLKQLYSKKFGGSAIYLSTILGFKTEGDIETIVKLKKRFPQITDVCLHHDVVFDAELNRKVKKLKEAGINPTVLVNESCYKECPYRSAHYHLLGLKEKEDCFQEACVKKRSGDPKELINLTGFVHPRQIERFSSETGVESFKIAGRGRTPEWIERTINAYTLLKVPENLMDIIVYTLSDGFFYVSSRGLKDVALYKLSDSEKTKLARKMLLEGKIRVERTKNIWVGIGIAENYLAVVKRLPKFADSEEHDSLLIVLADKLSKDYNNNLNKKLLSKLEEEAQKLSFKKTKAKVVRWEYFSKNKEFDKILKRYKELYRQNKIFRNDVNELVKSNRQGINKTQLEQRAGYVLEELASIAFQARKNFVKIGPEISEKGFDKLAKKFPLADDNKFDYFEKIGQSR